ncbi:hypothetical protein [Winogradskyella alexanderae]|uniref:DUF4252 domain-containing protein n=1 Tax=Winogradskyella alexanderae TaxID=2877123 RepID=A0ABS7XV27_9FLAO|nr:hypothetical protein [Winogradskyella alexanderae]MCA0133876.1 hypothetical protein [Winogradskyella alexanderae]
MKKAFIILLLLTQSCHENFNGKNLNEKEKRYAEIFKNKFTQNMHDPDSYEFVDLKLRENMVTEKDYIKIKKIINNETISIKSNDKKKEIVQNILNEFKDNIYDELLIKVRGKNRFNALVIDEHRALFLNNKLMNIDNETLNVFALFPNEHDELMIDLELDMEVPITNQPKSN